MITLINKVTVTGDPAEFQRANLALAEFMRVQPGARRFQLLQAMDEPNVYVEVAEWESREHHAAAIQAPGFMERAKAMRAVADFDRAMYAVLRTEQSDA